MILTLANQLTILRMALVPGLVILVIYGRFGWALVLFFIAGLTDALDGLFARIRGEQTRLGAMLDPLADKLLVSGALVVLSVPNAELTVRIPAWITILAISRDVGILLAVLIINLAIERRAFPPSLLGKATTLVQLATILWILWCNYGHSTSRVTEVLLGAMVLFTIASALHYMLRVRKIIGEMDEAAEGSK